MTAITNPKTGKALILDLDSEALNPANNLADIYDMPTALTNLGIGNAAVTVTVTAVAGATNVSTVTVTVKDANGATVPGVQMLELWTASDAAGTTISATAYSGTLVPTTGTILVTVTAHSPTPPRRRTSSQ